MSRDDSEYIISRLWKLFNVNRGIYTPNQSFASILGLLFLKVCNLDEYKNKIILPKASEWPTLLSSDDPVRSFREAIKAIEQENTLFEGVTAFIKFDSTSDSIKEKEIITEVLKTIDSLPYDGNVDFRRVSDLLINLFIGTASKYYNESYTPPSFKWLVKSLLDGKKIEQAYDPCIGIGSFLEFSPDQIKHFEAHEIHRETRALSVLTHFIAGYDNFNILNKNCLTEPFVTNNKIKKFDLVLAFPPFNMRLDGQTVDQLEHDQWGRFRSGVSNDGNWAFTQHILSTLKDDGIAFTVLPLGALFKTGVNRQIRRDILESGVIDTIIQLPDRLYWNTTIPSALLIFKKDRKENNSVFFIKADDTGKIQGRDRILQKEDLKKLKETFLKKKEQENFAKYVSLEEISKNDYNLLPNRYILEEIEFENIDVSQVIESLHEANEKASQAKNNLIKELKYFEINLS